MCQRDFNLEWKWGMCQRDSILTKGQKTMNISRIFLLICHVICLTFNMKLNFICLLTKNLYLPFFKMHIIFISFSF